MNAQKPYELLPDCSSCAKHADLESLRRRQAVHDWQGHGYKMKKPAGLCGPAGWFESVYSGIQLTDADTPPTCRAT